MKKISLFGLVLAAAFTANAQDATLPPPEQRPVFTVHGRGVQIYACKSGAGLAQWVFVAPAARLFDANGSEVGSHGDGPVWHLKDGSSVLGKVVAKTPSPDAGAVPWLLLTALRTDGTGELAGVEFIRRSGTKGGNAPAGACEADTLLRVPYEATYTFYSSK